MTARPAPVITLDGYRLPEAAALQRDFTRPEKRRTEYYLSAYDRRTLVYDCVYLDQAQGHLFTAPRFLNLWKPFRAGLRRDGKPVARVKRRTWLRCEQVFVPGPNRPMTLEIDGGTVTIPVRANRSADFAGRNCLVAVSKNNHLDWIANWAGFHARDHGCTGVVLFDNGSTDYSLDELAATLSAVPGIEQALVVSAPFPYGPADKSGRFDVSPRFFQTAMLNLARRDMFAQARAVLSIDIDEMVHTPQGVSVYDLAVKNPLGMVTIPGNWVYPAPDHEGPAPQSAHVFRAEPTKPCHGKWCMVPQGPMARGFGWAVHKMGGILQPLLTRQDQVSLLHCRGCSTGWKASRFNFPDPLVQDSALTALMSRHFGGEA